MGTPVGSIQIHIAQIRWSFAYFMERHSTYIELSVNEHPFSMSFGYSFSITRIVVGAFKNICEMSKICDRISSHRILEHTAIVRLIGFREEKSHIEIVGTVHPHGVPTLTDEIVGWISRAEIDELVEIALSIQMQECAAENQKDKNRM